MEASPQAARVRLLQPRGPRQQGRVVRVVPRAGQRDEGGASTTKLLSMGWCLNCHNDPAPSSATGGPGDEPGVGARNDARRRRRRDPEEPAGEAADELPELSSVTDDAGLPRARTTMTDTTRPTPAASTNRSSPASPTSSNRPARPSRSTPTRPRPRSTAARSSRSRLPPHSAAAAGCRRPDLQILPVLRDPRRPDRPHRPRPADVLRDRDPAARRRAAGAGRKPRRPADEDRRQPANTPRAAARPTPSRRPRSSISTAPTA